MSEYRLKVADFDLAAALASAFQTRGDGVRGVDVDLTDGIVTLSGEVETHEDAHRAEAIAHELGLPNVVNLITVCRDGAPR